MLNYNFICIIFIFYDRPLHFTALGEIYSSVTRGHSLKLQNNRTKYDLHKFYFANRVGLVNTWNALPSHVVSVGTMNCFKTRLDKFWLNQDILYSLRSEIHKINWKLK